MKKYRIKIIERKNGLKYFIPQVLINDFWLNIVYILNVLGEYKYVESSSIREEQFKEEDDALKLINQYREQEEYFDGMKIKSETFKEVL